MKLKTTAGSNAYGHMTDIPWDHQVALGLVDGVSFVYKWGENKDVDGATEDVWTPGGSRTDLTTASTLTIVSTSNEDGAGTQTGALSMVIEGLDSDWLEQVESVTLTGTTPIVTTSTWLRINRMYVTSSGSEQHNVGDINVTATTGGSTQGQIAATTAQTQSTHFAVPANKRGLIVSIDKSIDGGTKNVEVDIHLEVKVFGSNTWRNRHEEILLDTATSNHNHDWYIGGIYVGPKSDIVVRAEVIGGTNVHVNSAYTVVLYETEV